MFADLCIIIKTMMRIFERGKHDLSAETPLKKRTEPPPDIKSPKEEVLASREKVSSKKIGRGVTDSSFVELKDDGKGVFKTQWYKTERAAYLVDRFLGINLTPPTTIRNLDGEIGSMQEFIPDSETFLEMKFQSESDRDDFVRRHRDEFMRMWVFDLMIGNSDRHFGNSLFSGDVLYAIDHGHSLDHYKKDFLEKIERITGCYGSKYDSFFDEELPLNLVQRIKRFLENLEYQQILEDLLKEMIGKECAAACLRRVRFIRKMVVETGKISKDKIGFGY